MKILCIGQSKHDMIMNISDKMPANGKINVSDIVECSGGRALNVSYMLGKYKHDSYLASVVGDDTFGQNIKKDLDAIGTHSEYVETAFGKRTTISMYINNKVDNTKINYNISKEPLYMKKSEFQVEPDLIYLDGYDYGASQPVLARYNNIPKVISASVYNKEILELCKYCNYMIISKEFAESMTGITFDLTNPSNLVDIYSRVINKFPGKIIVISIAEQGALYMVDNQIRVMPSLNLDKKDATDSDIIFDGAFVYAILQKYDIEKAVTFANIASGLSVLKVGVRNSIPELSEIMTYFNQKYPEGK